MEPFLAEIRIIAGNFAPRGWAFCNGQVLAIAQNTALFSLLGFNYGGNGTTTFALPNLQGQVAMNQGQGPGLSNRVRGEAGGQLSNTLLLSNMPAHTHPAIGTNDPSNVDGPATAHYLAAAAGSRGQRGPAMYTSNSIPSPVPLDPTALSIEGGSVPYYNVQPVLALSFIIALQGIFPAVEQ